MSKWITIALTLSLVPAASALAADATPSFELPNAYRVGGGDVLNVQVYDENDLSGTAHVDDTGMVHLPLLGQVQVAGLTVREIDDALTAMLARDYLVDPHVTVEVAEYGSQPIQVLGAVQEPGVYYLRGATSLLDVLAEAGGLNSERSSSEIHVKRVLANGLTNTISVSQDALLGRGDNNIRLRSGDVVYIPEGLAVYVTGEVNEPGALGFTEGMTVTQALNAAGGPTQLAAMRYAYLLRDGEQVRVPLKDILKGRADDVPLKAGDQLFIEESKF